jgi:hypothetical protein
MKCFPITHYLFSLRSKYSPQHLYLCFLLNVSEQHSHTDITNKVTVRHTLVFMFRTWVIFNWMAANIPTFNLILISLWIQFRFVTVFPKYLSSAYIFKGSVLRKFNMYDASYSRSIITKYVSSVQCYKMSHLGKVPFSRLVMEVQEICAPPTQGVQITNFY